MDDLQLEYIPMSILEYRFDDDGKTEQIHVAFQLYDGSNQFNSRVVLTEEYVQSVNENIELDRMNKEQCENYARRYLHDWLRVTQEEVVEEEEEVKEEDAEQ